MVSGCGEVIAVGVLKMLEGDVPGRIVVAQSKKMVLSRHPNCEIVLDNAAVSWVAMQFLENHGTYFVEDLQSRNGTIVNGERIEAGNNSRPRIWSKFATSCCDSMR